MSQKIRLALSLFCLFSLFTFASDAYAVVVPDVVGLSQAQAQAAITDAELFSGNITYQYRESDTNGIVFDQDPNALETVSTGSYVSLNVSLGPWPCHVPDLYGLSQTEAETAIIDAGLAIGDISYRLEEPNSPTDFVISQSPKADTGVAFDTEVNFTIIITEFNLLLGSGTEYDPYLIQNLDDFDIFADSAYSSALWTTGVHTQLACNLDLSGRTYNGAVIASNMEYSGIFDGGGFYISNLVSYVGLFGKISSTGIVENLYCADFVIDGYYYCGTVCGSNYGTIINCSASGSVTGDESLGGLCGYNDGTVSYCAANCMIAGDDNLGGLCGSNRGAISNCSAFGTVTGGYDSDYLGGLCGYNRGAISNSSAFGTVTGGYDSDYLGGLCGYNRGAISNSSAFGTVTGGYDSDYLGGLCGYNYDADITNCYASGDISGTDYIGGLCGYNYYGTISNCYSTGFVSGNNYIAGLCGIQSGSRPGITNCFWDTQTSGTTVGYNLDSGTVTNVLGKTTTEMQDINIFLSAGWDFDGESANGTDDIWTMAGYPTLSQDISTYWGVVPDLTGLTQNDAIWDIFDAGLLVGFIYYSNEYPVDPDHVITQSPAPGLPGCRVDLLVSLGFRPRVPDIIGLAEADARNEIINAELSVGDVSYQFDDSIPYDIVISQSPDPSVKVTPDTPVDFVVSLGAPFIVPDLSYMTQAEAESAILNAGLPVGKISYKYHENIPNDQVCNQSPVPDTFAHLYTPVDFSISIGSYQPLDGSGTEADPYLIHSIDDFDIFTDHNTLLFIDPNNYPDYYSKDIHIKLMADIDLSSKPVYSAAPIAPVAPIAQDPNLPYLPYSGHFDGNGFSISNLTIDSSYDYVGLFNELSSDATIKNLACVNFNINGNNYCGSLVGHNSGTISNCYATGSVDGDNYLGGLCGYNDSGTISNCYADGSVSGDDYLGGLCGNSYYGTFSNCYATGSVTGDTGSWYLGGLCGYNDNGTISNCYATGSVSGDDYLGGLCGYNYRGTIKDCFANSSVTGVDYLGGLCGYNFRGTISNCYATGSVSGNRYLGGLCGFNFYGTITNCYAASSVSGGSNLGGLCGYNDNGTISNCYSTGSVTGGDGSRYLGGLCGRNLVGTISNCYATGSVSGDDYLGGLCGYNYSGTISNCYAASSVSDGSRLGGLCGYQYGNNSLIENSFWDTQTSGLSIGVNQHSRYPGTVTNLQGLTTAQMQDIDTFLDAGWDFVAESANGTDDLWHMPYQSTGYPMLFFQRDIPGDLTGTYGVDIADFAAISDSWLIDYNLSDLEILTNFWLEQ